MCTIVLLFMIAVFLCLFIILIKINEVNECNYEGYNQRKVDQNRYIFDSINTSRVMIPSQFEFEPCSNNGFAENGICKSCPNGMNYNQKDGLCYNNTRDILKKFDKICPRDTIPFNDKCIYPCPIGFIENETTQTCDPKRSTGIKPYLSPMHCPLETPYLNKTTMKCQKNTPVILNTTSIFQPLSADSSVIM